MKIEINIPDYSVSGGLKLDWEDSFTIKATISGDTVHILADEGGLKSLARHFLTLAQNSVPKGRHVHFDSSNSFEDGSCEMIIEKM